MFKYMFNQKLKTVHNVKKKRKESDAYLATFRKHHPCTPAMSTESSQVGVALFPSF